MKDIVVVGCGLSGAYLSRELAEKGYNVKVIEKRKHIGGNMYDSIEELTGCRIQNYGPHIFHTSDEWAWKYMNKYTEFTPFKLTSEVLFPEYNKFVPGPFNFLTIDLIYKRQPDKRAGLKNRLEEYFNIDLSLPPSKRTVSIVDMMNSDDELIKEFAYILWTNDYQLYTAKQWGIKPEEVDYNILSRVPFYCSYHDGIFNDTYEGVATEGYTKIFENMLDHKNIEVILNENALEKLSILGDKVYYCNTEVCLIWTGAIDELFGYCYGPLAYKTVDFVYNVAPHRYGVYGDPCSTILPDSRYEFTRITNYGRLPIQNDLALDVLLYEYPRDYVLGKDKERYYPISSPKDKELYAKYKELADRVDNLFLSGRLADYKYYDMDKALLAAKSKLEVILKHLEEN